MYLLESTAHPIPSEKEQGKVGITGSAKSRDNRPSVRGCDRQITGTLNILLFEIMLQFITHHTDRYDESPEHGPYSKEATAGCSSA